MIFTPLDTLVNQMLTGHPLVVIWFAYIPVRLAATFAGVWSLARYVLPWCFRCLPKLSYLTLHALWYGLLLFERPITRARLARRTAVHTFDDLSEAALLRLQRLVIRAAGRGRWVQRLPVRFLLVCSACLLVPLSLLN